MSESKVGSTNWYAIIAAVIGMGYLIGIKGWLDYADLGVTAHEQWRQFLACLFFVGIIGGSMHCSVFLAKDANSVIGKSGQKPTYIDVLGYVLQIIGGGITGVLLYLFVVEGIVQVVSAEETKPSIYMAWIIALAGGFGTHRVKRFLDTFAAGATDTPAKAKINKPVPSKH